MEGKENVKFEEFEPFCKWQRKEDRDILEIHLQDFKKEQLKVQISNYGFLKISGERPLDSSRKSKFYKEVQISKNYDAPAINAKFANGLLYITMPKSKNLVPEKNEKWPVGPSTIGPNSNLNPKTNTNPSSSPSPMPNARPESKTPTLSNNNMTSGAIKDQMPTPGGSGSPASEFQRRRWATSGRKVAKVVVTLAATVAMMVALIAYVVYMHKAINVGVDDD